MDVWRSYDGLRPSVRMAAWRRRHRPASGDFKTARRRTTWLRSKSAGERRTVPAKSRILPDVQLCLQLHFTARHIPPGKLPQWLDGSHSYGSRGRSHCLLLYYETVITLCKSRGFRYRVSYKLDPSDPCCHGKAIFACCHKSSASVKERRATITLGFATLSSFDQIRLD